MIFYYQYKNKNSAISHNVRVEADNQAQAQKKLIKKLGTNFEIRFVMSGDGDYTASAKDPLADINSKDVLNHDEVI